MNAELSALLNYKNDAVVVSFCHRYPEYSIEDGQQIFADLLSWMWLNKQRKILGKKTYLFGPLLLLDEIWHIFILHTRAYIDFSLRYFGEYFHHDVEPIGFEHNIEEEELTDFLQDSFTFLDEGWVARRFSSVFLEKELLNTQ